MGAISLNKLVKINSGVVASAANGMTLATMLMSKNALIPINDTQRALPFTTASQVGDYFGVNSAEYSYAGYYFKGYSGQVGVAKLLWIGRWVDDAQGAYIRGNKLNPTTTLTALKAIKAGAITFTFNSSTQALTALDFSGASSLSACATILQTALSASIAGATVTYSSLTQSFTAQAPAGDGSTNVGYCTTGTLATLLKMTSETLAVLSQGITAQTPAENWQAMVRQTRNWACGCKLWEIEASPFAESIADCEWFNAQNGDYAYAPYSSTLATALAFKSVVSDAEYANVFVNYSLANFVAGQVGALAAVGYSERAARISLTNKSYSGITPLVTDDTTYDLLVAAKINFYGRFQSRNDTFNFAEEGWLTGDWLYLENLYNNIWVADQLQIRQANVLSSSKVLPYTDIGYQSITAALNTVGGLAQNNFVAEAGNVFSAEITQKLNNEAGFDLAGALTQQGYYGWVIPATYDERVSRSPVKGYFYYTNGGNIGKITINNVFVV